MKQGDFTKLAKDYIYRTGYSQIVLKSLASYMGAFRENFVVADVGAGTGKLTENLLQLGFSGYAVEPNDAMRAEGIRLLGADQRIKWQKGSAEITELPDSSVDWVLMGSSFHWTDQQVALKEFHRILKPNGFFTALWNPREIEKSDREKNIEKMISRLVPNLKRVSSGSKKYTENLEETLLSSSYFDNLIFMDSPHEVSVSPDHYLGAWRSVNDIQAQAGEQIFCDILENIAKEISGLHQVVVPYRTRAWTVQAR